MECYMKQKPRLREMIRKSELEMEEMKERIKNETKIRKRQEEEKILEETKKREKEEEKILQEEEKQMNKKEKEEEEILEEEQKQKEKKEKEEKERKEVEKLKQKETEKQACAIKRKGEQKQHKETERDQETNRKSKIETPEEAKETRREESEQKDDEELKTHKGADQEEVEKEKQEEKPAENNSEDKIKIGNVVLLRSTSDSHGFGAVEHLLDLDAAAGTRKVDFKIKPKRGDLYIFSGSFEDLWTIVDCDGFAWKRIQMVETIKMSKTMFNLIAGIDKQKWSKEVFFCHIRKKFLVHYIHHGDEQITEKIKVTKIDESPKDGRSVESGKCVNHRQRDLPTRHEDRPLTENPKPKPTPFEETLKHKSLRNERNSNSLKNAKACYCTHQMSDSMELQRSRNISSSDSQNGKDKCCFCCLIS